MIVHFLNTAKAYIIVLRLTQITALLFLIFALIFVIVFSTLVIYL